MIRFNPINEAIPTSSNTLSKMNDFRYAILGQALRLTNTTTVREVTSQARPIANTSIDAEILRSLSPIDNDS